jgi:putative transposase
MPLQQLREAILSDHTYGFLIHDRDSIFSREFDQSVRNLGLQVHRTPVRSPKANAVCERLLGMLRRECLDFVMPLTEDHRRRVLKDWVRHYNAGRPHMALGPGIPRPPLSRPGPPHAHRHWLPEHLRVVARPILGSSHHEHQLVEKAA